MAVILRGVGVQMVMLCMFCFDPNRTIEIWKACSVFDTCMTEARTD